MKCPVCVEKGLKSSVYPGMMTSTAMYCPPYYDEDGNYHSHDGNTHTTNYSCSQGHTWAESSKGTCPSCDFGKDSHSITIYNSEEPTKEEASNNDVSIFGGDYEGVDGTDLIAGSSITASDSETDKDQ